MRQVALRPCRRRGVLIERVALNVFPHQPGRVTLITVVRVPTDSEEVCDARQRKLAYAAEPVADVGMEDCPLLQQAIRIQRLKDDPPAARAFGFKCGWH